VGNQRLSVSWCQEAQGAAQSVGAFRPQDLLVWQRRRGQVHQSVLVAPLAARLPVAVDGQVAGRGDHERQPGCRVQAASGDHQPGRASWAASSAAWGVQPRVSAARRPT